MKTFEQITDPIPDAASRDHAWMIYGLVRWLQPCVAVEIGSFHGYMSCWIARALLDNGQGVLHCVDNFTLRDAHPDTLRRNLQDAGVGKVVQIIEGDSNEVELPEQIDFAFIDGDHTLEGCTRDVVTMMDRGVRCIVVHDTTNWWGPREWVDEFRNGFRGYLIEWDIIEATHGEGLTVLLRRPVDKPEPGWDRNGHPSGSA